MIPEQETKSKALAKVRACVEIPLSRGAQRATFVTFEGLSDRSEHIAICFDGWEKQSKPFVRVHSECLTGDIFGSKRCDCGSQLDEAMETLSRNAGVLLYLRQEGRGLGLYNKLDAYRLQLEGHDTYEANHLLGFPDDLRDFRCAAEMLRSLSIQSIRLLSNNPRKSEQLQAYGIEVAECIRTVVDVNPYNRRYLAAKSLKGRHQFSSLKEINR